MNKLKRSLYFDKAKTFKTITIKNSKKYYSLFKNVLFYKITLNHRRNKKLILLVTIVYF